MMPHKGTRSIYLDSYDFKNVAECATIALLGKRRAGKTTWCRYIIQWLRDRVNRTLVLCGNSEGRSQWSQFVMPLFVHDGDVSVLQRLIEYQSSIIKNLDMGKGDSIPEKYHVLIIIDDCGSDRKFMRHQVMDDLMANGRHYGIYMIVLLQSLSQMNISNRNQMDYIGVLFTNNHKNIKHVYEEYASMVPIQTFKVVLRHCTVRRGMCWIDNTMSGSHVEDLLYYHRMPKVIRYRHLGSSIARRFARLNFRVNCNRSLREDSPPQAKPIFLTDSGGSDSDTDPDFLTHDRELDTDSLMGDMVRPDLTRSRQTCPSLRARAAKKTYFDPRGNRVCVFEKEKKE